MSQTVDIETGINAINVSVTTTAATATATATATPILATNATAAPVQQQRRKPLHSDLAIVLGVTQYICTVTPFIALDIYFMIVDNTCMDIHVSAAGGLSLRNYLTGCVITGLTSLLFIPFLLIYTKSINIKELLKYHKEFDYYIPGHVFSVFGLIWYIIGNIIYMGNLRGQCARAFDTYLLLYFIFSYIYFGCTTIYDIYCVSL